MNITLSSLLVFALCLSFSSPAFSAAGNPPWTERAVSENELLELENSNPDLDINTCREILSRLNIKEAFYIREDIRNGKKLKVPNDFRAYKEWTPLPVQLPASLNAPKFILIVKDIPFIGWYESGVLLKDSQACIGHAGQDTRAGFYRVELKDAEHVSRSYPNEYGKPAWMPFSLHIYEAVYIHAGNVFGARCSHGCIILPVDNAEKLFGWADVGTRVLVVESLGDFEREVRKGAAAGGPQVRAAK
ncbi:MAG: L,D-transpeptidase [Desulfobacteraceae bacterium]|nr:L,D-transpeptidase [Desulfobacteraceae bacterium]